MSVIAFTIFGCATQPSGEGWITLLDGSSASLNNWNRIGDANWRSEGGAIVADKAKETSFLVSKNSYTDFQIRAEFWADHNTNSGIFMRVSDPQNITDKNAYEANIFDQRPDQAYATGGIVHLAKVSSPVKAGGRWNTYEITAKGPQLTVVLNGVRTAELRDTKFARGPIALQYGAKPGGAIKWRKVEIRPL